MKRLILVLSLTIFIIKLSNGQVKSNNIHENNCIIYYNNFDYKNTGNYFIIAEGNMVDSLKEGHWTISLSSGIILAEGKYKKGLKVGPWYYLNSNGFYNKLVWKKKDLVLDRLGFIENKYALIIDFSLNKKMALKRTSNYPYNSVHYVHFL